MIYFQNKVIIFLLWAIKRKIRELIPEHFIHGKVLKLHLRDSRCQ